MKPVTPPPLREPGSLILAKAHAWVNGFFLQLPNIAAALVFLLAAYGAGKLASRAIRAVAHRRGRLDLGSILGSIVFGAVMLTATLVAAAIVFPSVKPADVLATLGVGSVAIGFAFKDILQNLLAGVLLLINRPFRRGDQIRCKDFEGTVEHVESRATVLKTYDGRRVIIPNAEIYTSPVTVLTAYPIRRAQVDIGIGYGDDVDDAARVFAEVVRGIEGVADDPAVEVLPWSLDESTITLRTRWWCDSKRTAVVHTTARVVQAVAAAAREHGIDLAFPTRVVLLRDEREEAPA
jgi:small conductance mechanosensitive channel